MSFITQVTISIVIYFIIRFSYKKENSLNISAFLSSFSYVLIYLLTYEVFDILPTLHFYAAGNVTGDFEGHSSLGKEDGILVKMHQSGIKRWSRRFSGLIRSFSILNTILCIRSSIILYIILCTDRKSVV